MKTKADLMKLVTILVLRSSREMQTVWVDFSGHVNHLSVRYLPTGYEHAEKNNLPETKMGCYLNKENEVQMMYYFILSTFPAHWFESI